MFENKQMTLFRKKMLIRKKFRMLLKNHTLKVVVLFTDSVIWLKCTTQVTQISAFAIPLIQMHCKVDRIKCSEKCTDLKNVLSIFPIPRLKSTLFQPISWIFYTSWYLRKRVILAQLFLIFKNTFTLIKQYFVICKNISLRSNNNMMYSWFDYQISFRNFH